MFAGMTDSEKTIWVKSLLQLAQMAIYLLPNSYFDIHKRSLMVINGQMADAAEDAMVGKWRLSSANNSTDSM